MGCTPCNHCGLLYVLHCPLKRFKIFHVTSSNKYEARNISMELLFSIVANVIIFTRVFKSHGSQANLLQVDNFYWKTAGQEKFIEWRIFFFSALFCITWLFCMLHCIYPYMRHVAIRPTNTIFMSPHSVIFLLQNSDFFNYNSLLDRIYFCPDCWWLCM